MSLENLENRPVLFCYDVDNTVRPGQEHTLEAQERGRVGLTDLGKALRAEKHWRRQFNLPRLYSGPATGRVMASLDKLARKEPYFNSAVMLESDLAITSVGTHLAWRRKPGGKLTQDNNWPPSNPLWRPDEIRAYLDKHPRMLPQEDEVQGYAKISYMITGVDDNAAISYSAKLAAELSGRGWPGQVIISGQGELKYCDVLPPEIDKGAPYAYARDLIAAQHNGVRPVSVFAGDGMNDRGPARIADLTILPANAEPAFREWARDSEEVTGVLFEAEQDFAHGLLEGLVNYGVIGPRRLA